MIERKSCAVCSLPELEKIHIFKDFPIYMGAKLGQEEIRMDQEWGICKGCGCVQLLKLVDLDLLYKVPHNPAIGKTWERHNREFAEFIDKNSGERILEIGGGNLKIYDLIDQRPIKDYCIYDSHIYEEKSGPRIVNSFINPDNFKDGNSYDTIIMSHVFEHFYEPRKFVKLSSDILGEDGRVILSIPNSTNMIRDSYPNGVCFEHTYQVDSTFAEMMMADFGFQLDAVKEFNDHNHFMSFKKCSRRSLHRIIRDFNFHDLSRSSFLKFVKEYEGLASLVSEISDNSNRNIYLFGCHIFSQMVLECGLNENKVKGILDNDINKQGDMLYGTDIPVYSPEVVREMEDVFILVKCGIYSIEIARQLKCINPNCSILI